MMMSVYLAIAMVVFSPAQASDPAPAPTAASEKRICKKTAETGSLVSRRKECRTRAEWDRIASAARENGQDIVGRNGGLPALGN
ncbi:hypothetical protein OKW76_08425 [Sphingomonas sp. S1-29]|uniref:hypothetical protein n=1 Tax=Sphingomonas sp. S1-29 TaxID=2991074 RepID=UPI00223FBF96|nr:hypothetical protein [Sphingomonas sp. S1-29]UZK68107.1 hypothetical protein OKW76_08425 [Sphingomonas sp. S1-29]